MGDNPHLAHIETSSKRNNWGDTTCWSGVFSLQNCALVLSPLSALRASCPSKGHIFSCTLLPSHSPTGWVSERTRRVGRFTPWHALLREHSFQMKGTLWKTFFWFTQDRTCVRIVDNIFFRKTKLRFILSVQFLHIGQHHVTVYVDIFLLDK